jgi:hypothetical protein
MRKTKNISEDVNTIENGKKSGNSLPRRIGTEMKAEVELNMQVPADFMEARKNIANLVRISVNEIAARFIADAKAGHVASAKYLFEVAGLYPATAETSAVPDNSLAYTLLKRMGLPTDPLV